MLMLHPNLLTKQIKNDVQHPTQDHFRDPNTNQAAQKTPKQLTHTHTHSSLSHECAADRGLSPLTPKLVVTICVKVSPCFPFRNNHKLRSCFRLAPSRPDSWGRFASATPSWQQGFQFLIFFFFLPRFNNPYGLQISAETLPSCLWHIHWHQVHVSVCHLPDGQEWSLINWPGWRVGHRRFSHLWAGVQEKHFWCDL